jgi:hypothetical protein
MREDYFRHRKFESREMPEGSTYVDLHSWEVLIMEFPFPAAGQGYLYNLFSFH